MKKKKKKVIHTITIKFYTEKGIYTDWIWTYLSKMIGKDERFIKDFDRIVITGKNNLE